MTTPTCGSSWVCMPVTPGGNVTSRTRTRALSRTILTVLWLLPLACGGRPAAVAIRGPLTRAPAPRAPPSTRPDVKPAISLFIAVFYPASQDRIATEFREITETEVTEETASHRDAPRHSNAESTPPRRVNTS